MRWTLTKFDEVIRSLSLVYVLTVLFTELLVYVLQVGEGQLGRVGLLAQRQVAYPFLYDVAACVWCECQCVCVGTHWKTSWLLSMLHLVGD